jgi:hypothetical protein
MSDYDGSVAVSRKLTEDEILQLRSACLPLMQQASSSEEVAAAMGSVDDITDFLDYAFAMISNSKSVDYVVQELIGMEMGFCPPAIAKEVGKELAAGIQQIISSTETEQDDGQEEEGEEDHQAGAAGGGGRVVSLKVCIIIFQKVKYCTRKKYT